ncbi:hypothetical protein [Rhizobium halophilum]|uniref:hypothetical protein n=1 Tax=Rhizobium halophilum TaxID=2846852 RepID=UPI001EFDC035|nr:hypothetical protein [Rhizobium halophilum]MCF6370795.1 hypothetical protein [Rhizobium halophilum]
MSDAKPPAYDAQLAARTAEALALPHLVCRRRACRRKNRCLWCFRSTGERCCMRNLTAEQRRIFDTVYHEANAAWHFLGTDPHWFETLEGPRRAADDLGIAIARTHSHRWRSEKWDAAWRTREKLLAQFDKERTSGKDGLAGGRG